MVAADWGQYVDAAGWRFHCMPAQHFSGRGLFDRNTTLWASWYMAPEGDAVPSLFFAGDTGYAPHFACIRGQLGAPDVACLPIGANRPRAIMRPVPMNPHEALRAFHDLGAQHLVPMHWGTFDLADEPVQEPADRLLRGADRQAIADRVHVLDIGGTLRGGRRAACGDSALKHRRTGHRGVSVTRPFLSHPAIPASALRAAVYASQSSRKRSRPRSVSG